MKSYSKLLEGFKTKHAIVVTDAHPFNRGAVEHALGIPGEKHIFVSEPKNPRTDPMTAEEKKSMLATMYPAHKSAFKLTPPEIKTNYHVLDHIANKCGCTHATMICDPDKHEDMEKKLHAQNGKFNIGTDGKRAGYSIKLKVTKHPGSEPNNIDFVHKAAVNNDWKGVNSALPVGQFSDDVVHALMGKLRHKLSDSAVVPAPVRVVKEGEELTETKKKVGEYTHGAHITKVYKLTGEHDEGDPYKVELHRAGKHYEPADYFTNDLEDAHGTAKHMVKEGFDPEILNRKADLTKIDTQKLREIQALHRKYGEKGDKRSAEAADRGAAELKSRGHIVESVGLDEGGILDPNPGDKYTKADAKMHISMHRGKMNSMISMHPTTYKTHPDYIRSSKVVDDLNKKFKLNEEVELEIGNMVETREGVIAEIINIGPNYVTLVAEGKTFRTWTKDVTISEGKHSTTRLNKEQFIIKGYKTKNFTRELAEQFSKVSKNNDDSYAIYNLAVALDSLLGMNEETLPESFEDQRKNFDRAVKYARRFDMTIDQLSIAEDTLLEYSICEGTKFCANDKMKVAHIIASTAGVITEGTAEEIVDRAASTYSKGKKQLSLEGWSVLGELLNKATESGIKWDKNVLSTNAQKYMGLK